MLLMTKKVGRISLSKVAYNVQATACQPNTLDGFGWWVVAIVRQSVIFYNN